MKQELLHLKMENEHLKNQTNQREMCVVDDSCNMTAEE